MDLDSPSIPPLLDPGRVADKDTTSNTISSSHRRLDLLRAEMQRGLDSQMRDPGQETRLAAAADDATSIRVPLPQSNLNGREHSTSSQPNHSQQPAYTLSASYSQPPSADASLRTQSSQWPRLPVSSNTSQETSTVSTNDADLVFTPPASEGGRSPANANGRDSSQESQLLQLSQIAAAQERIPDNRTDMEVDVNGTSTRKRMADGMVKHTRGKSDVSPVRLGGHSRNTSTVSMASTTGSRNIGEVCLLRVSGW